MKTNRRQSKEAAWAKFAEEIVKAIDTRQGAKPKAYDTQAEVVRVKDGTAWVHIPGGVAETPVRETIACRKGDTVQVRVADGRATITGNSSAPPTDDKTAKAAQEAADDAMAAAEAAQEAADGTSQFFWYRNGNDSEAGAHVTEVSRETFEKKPQGGNLLLRSNSVKLRMALITLAELTGTSLTFYDPNTNEWRIKLDTDGAHLKGKTVSSSYSYADLLAQVFRIGYHSALNNEDIISEFFGNQGFSNYMYSRKTMTNTPPSFRSTVHDENGFRFVRDNGTNPQTIGTAANSYLFESGGLKEDGLRLGWVYAGALRSLTDLNAPEADGDHIFVSESENGTQLVDVIYDEASDEADMDLRGDLTAGSVAAGTVSSSGNVTAAGKLTGGNLDAGSDTATTAASGSTTTKAVSFHKTFTAAPKVVVGFTYDNSATGTTNSFGNCAISAVDITTTGFTAKFYNGSGTQKTPTFDWIALLP